jgi:UPF0716 protein FxsA
MNLVVLLVFVFVAVPLIELWLLLLVGGHIGFWPTVGITLVTALVGARLASGEGRRVLDEWRRALALGKVPDGGILGGVLVLVGGVLLVTPGLLTDGLGLALLFPPTRRIIAAGIRSRLETRIIAPDAGMRGPGGKGIFFWSVHVADPGRTPSRTPRPRGTIDVIDVEGESKQDDPPRQLPR